MFYFTSLLGAQSPSSASQSLIELEGGIKILVDLGWDESFDPSLLDELEKHAKSLSFILLTHATISHLAAYAHCCKHFPNFTTIPVYATPPVKSLGRALLQDLYASNILAASSIPTKTIKELSKNAGLDSFDSPPILLQPPTADEIAAYFNAIHPLKYSQPHQPESSPTSAPFSGLTITAYSAGHSLGGTMWLIQHELESIVYAVDWNQAKDTILQPAAWLGAGGGDVIENLRRPTALICSTRGTQRSIISGGIESRNSQLLQSIKSTLAQGGSVLIPTDSCARALEVSYFLEEAWNHEKPSTSGNSDSLRSAKLYFASSSGNLTMRYARSMIEWMDPDISRELESTNQGQDHASRTRAPFDFRFTKIIEKRKHINKILAQNGPKVIVATDSSLEWGHARRSFKSLYSDTRNLIVLLEESKQLVSDRPSLSSTLWNIYQQHKLSKPSKEAVDPQDEGVSYVNITAQPLEGNEQILYQQHLAQIRQKQYNNMASESGNNLRERDDVIDDELISDDDDDDDDSVQIDGEQQGQALNAIAALGQRHKAGLTDAELGVEIMIRKKGHYDFDVRGKKGRDRMFPVMPIRKAPRADEYGEVIKPDDYLRADERDNADEQEQNNNNNNNNNTNDGEKGLGQKRKWDEIVENGDTNGISKKRKADSDIYDGTTSSLTLTNNYATDMDISDDETEVDEDERYTEGPVKAVFTETTLALSIRITHIDFSGLHDKRSMQMLIPLIKPRKLVLIGGNIDETIALKEECQKLLGTGTSSDNATEIFTPTIGQILNASVDTNAWNVKLSMSLRRQLHWQNVGSLGVVPLTSNLTIEQVEKEENSDEAISAKRVKRENGVHLGSSNKENLHPILDLVQSSSVTSTRMMTRSLHVGDLRLSDLRKGMQTLGVGAEFRGEGTLLINGLVAVRKSAIGKVEVETVIGLPGTKVTDSTFDDVRKRIYASLAVISGS